MLVRCPRCAAPREAEPENAGSDPGARRPCVHCGYIGAAAPLSNGAYRDSLPSFAGARARLKDATTDLFRLTGGNSIPVEMSDVPAPLPKPPAPEPSPSSSGRKPEASIMFSLEELMKAANPIAEKREELPDQLWSMEAATPLFGTEYDQALLTTPLQPLQSSATDSMTVPSRPYAGRRRWPLLLVGGAASIALLAAGGVWLFGPLHDESVPALGAALSGPGPEQASLAATPPPELAAEAAPIAPVAAEAPALPAAAAPTLPVEPVAVEPGVGKETSAAGTAPRSTRSREKKPLPRAVVTSSSLLAPFDTQAAREALNAASSKAADCRQEGGATGKGKVQLTFATTGRVSSASIVEGPFTGTAAGNCALRHFRAAHVPPFSGTPQTVAKSFKIP